MCTKKLGNFFAKNKNQDTRYKTGLVTRKKQITRYKDTMHKGTNNSKYDLEDRSTNFAKQVIRLCKKLPTNPINNRLIGQITGSAGSIGANYREANDSLGSKDFIFRLKISRKEAKETIHWLILLQEANMELDIANEVNNLMKEVVELKNILSSIIIKAQQKTLS